MPQNPDGIFSLSNIDKCLVFLSKMSFLGNHKRILWGSTSVPPSLALALCLQTMTRPSCTTTTMKADMGLMAMMTMFFTEGGPDRVV